MSTICMECKSFSGLFTCTAPNEANTISFVTGEPVETSCHSRNKTGNCQLFRKAGWLTLFLRSILWR